MNILVSRRLSEYVEENAYILMERTSEINYSTGQVTLSNTKPVPSIAPRVLEYVIPGCVPGGG